jgi:glutaminase
MLAEILQRVHDVVVEDSGGNVASYIPALAEADPTEFGLALVTAGGDVFTAGQADATFTIQSVSKPFTLALALDQWGPDKVFKHVGTEPSGDAFNSVVLDAETSVPFNPMINSGAISMAGLLWEARGEGAFEHIQSNCSRFAGAELALDVDVHESELATAHRNRAIAHLMRGGRVIGDPVEEVVDLYTRQCSLTVSARQLAVMAATLANIGTNPLTKDTIVDPLTVRHVLSLMFTCGMYDYAGRWAVDVGLPAKSGVSGGVMAVVNRQLGIGLYSPRLDEHGNSVRAVKACVQLAEELGLHAFEFSNTGSSMLDIYMG